MHSPYEGRNTLYLTLWGKQFFQLIESMNQNPTAKSFHTIIKDNAATGNVKDVERGEELLRKLEDMYRTGESSFKPGMYVSSTEVFCYC